jgi:hypothetical protein
MLSQLLFPALLIGVAVFGWNGLAQRVDRDVAEWEISPQQGRRHVFMYRGWCVGFALTGVVLALLTLAGR